MTYLWLNDLQIPHLNATRGEIGNLKLDVDRPLAFTRARHATHASSEPTRHAAAVLVITLDAGQAKFRAHQELFGAAELLDLPDDGGLLRRIVHRANVGAEPRRVGVFGDGDKDLDVVRGAPAFELCFSLVVAC